MFSAVGDVVWMCGLQRLLRGDVSWDWFVWIHIILPPTYRLSAAVHAAYKVLSTSPLNHPETPQRVIWPVNKTNVVTWMS